MAARSHTEEFSPQEDPVSDTEGMKVRGARSNVVTWEPRRMLTLRVSAHSRMQGPWVLLNITGGFTVSCDWSKERPTSGPLITEESSITWGV